MLTLPHHARPLAQYRPYASPSCPEQGPASAGSTEPSLPFLVAMLDAVDYGLVLLSKSSEILHMNRAARCELDDEVHPLQVHGTKVYATCGRDNASLRDAVDKALQKCLRRFLTIGEGLQRLSIAIVPLHMGERSESTAALLVLRKRQVCEELSIEAYARSNGLTPGETRVLRHLGAGLCPAAIARQQQVTVATIRTQIASIRSKTGATSIVSQIRQLSALPPMLGILRPCDHGVDDLQGQLM